MTLILSLIHPNGIVMAADSRKTVIGSSFINDKTSDFVSYENKRKLFHINRTGCIAMWGDFTSIENKLSQYLLMHQAVDNDVENLSGSLLEFLSTTIDTNNNGDVGFHIAGYNSKGEPKLFHVFWGQDRGPNVDQKNNPQAFKKYDHSNFRALYNGNNVLGHLLIEFSLKLESELGILVWLDKYNIEITKQYAELLISQVAKVDDTVGGDIVVAIINQDNSFDINIEHSECLKEDITEFIVPSGISPNINHYPTGSESLDII